MGPSMPTTLVATSSLQPQEATCVNCMHSCASVQRPSAACARAWSPACPRHAGRRLQVRRHSAVLPCAVRCPALARYSDPRHGRVTAENAEALSAAGRPGSPGSLQDTRGSSMLRGSGLKLNSDHLPSPTGIEPLLLRGEQLRGEVQEQFLPSRRRGPPENAAAHLTPPCGPCKLFHFPLQARASAVKNGAHGTSRRSVERAPPSHLITDLRRVRQARPLQRSAHSAGGT
mmetsp:Transcript_69823/g.180071  ORF Transcript_69823/g.180071 Transcript_69823/m.180071 type:complete len:230 (-) Transcript_69823:115-804(-)